MMKLSTHHRLLLTLAGVLIAAAALLGRRHLEAKPETRFRGACISNLRQIDSAKEQLAIADSLPDGTPVTVEQIAPFLHPKFVEPLRRQTACPSGGRYSIGKLGEDPTCTVEGHELP